MACCPTCITQHALSMFPVRGVPPGEFMKVEAIIFIDISGTSGENQFATTYTDGGEHGDRFSGK
jgi:hypothetical protein